MNSCKKYLLITCCLFSLKTFGQVAPTLTLKDFLNAYIKKSKPVESKQSSVESSNEKVIEAKSQFLPSTNLVNSISKTDKLSGDGDKTINTKLRNQAYLKLTQNIYDGARDTSGYQYSKFQLEKSKWDVSDTKYTEVLNGLDLYYGYLKAAADLQNIKQEIETNNKSLQDLKRNLSNGNAKRSQVLSIQATLASNQVDLLEAENTLRTYLIKINQDLSTNYGSLNLVRNQSQFDFNPDLLKLEERADVQALRATTESLEQKIDVTNATRLPTLDLSGSYYLSDNSTSASLKDYYAVSLTLNIPFPFGTETRSQIAQARVEHNISLINQRIKEDSLQKEKKILIDNINSFIKRLKALEDAKNIAEENVKYLKKDFQAGLNSYSDYLSASTSYQQIIRKYDNAKIDYELALVKAEIWSGNIEKILN